jgi:Bacteriophage lambda head decoration protein D
VTANFALEGTYLFSQFALGKMRARKVIVKQGAGVVKAATVLGVTTADTKYLTSVAAATDGSQVPDAILSHDVDATAADVEAIVFIAGEFDQTKLILGAGHTLAEIDPVCRLKDIWLINPMACS